jgi:hypothetical protein
MTISNELIAKARELESDIQSAAFELLREDAAYAQAQGLLVVASDVNRLAARLSELLSSSEDAMKHKAGPRLTPRGRKGTARYPVFFVSEDRLVKIGKGKQKTAKEYRHEATRAAFDSVARWIESSALSGHREWHAKGADEDLQGKVPSYQVYLVIAALQAVGIVVQVRRGEYALSSDAGQPADWWSTLADLPLPASGGGERS